MTREKFLEKAAREMERRLRIPPGWWGTWREVEGFGASGVRVRVKFTGRAWFVTQGLGRHPVSKHDSRSFAITKARKL